MDSTDGCINSSFKKLNEKDDIGTKGYEESVVARMPTEKESSYYNMNHPKRGLAIILNHEIFNDSSLSTRLGTQHDCKCLVERLQVLSFDISIYNDLNYKTILKVVANAASADHTHHDCFVLCVMTHGHNGVLYAKDSQYKSEELWLPFIADECKTLAGKPKLFFIQSCRGDNLDKGVTLSRTVCDSQVHSYKIPTHADFLIAYSTVKGFSSWRGENYGSWFIQALCEELKENQYNKDLSTILIFVCRRVALEYESFVPDKPHKDRKKQIPCIISMLTRLVQFTPKIE